MRFSLRPLAVLAAGLIAATMASAQPFPQKQPIKAVVPFAATTRSSRSPKGSNMSVSTTPPTVSPSTRPFCGLRVSASGPAPVSNPSSSCAKLTACAPFTVSDEARRWLL